jgi:hypothetical protein
VAKNFCTSSRISVRLQVRPPKRPERPARAPPSPPVFASRSGGRAWALTRRGPGRRPFHPTSPRRQLYLQAKTAGTLYQTALRYELRTLGLRFRLRDNGLCELAGIGREVLRGFSRRRVEIEQELARRGESSRQAAQVATLATRKAKDYGVPAESLAAEWHRRADALGFDAAARARLFGRTRPVPPSRDVLAQAARVLLGEGGLTRRAAVLDRRDVLRAWCAQLPGGAPVGYVERLADTLLGDPEVVPIDPVTPEALRPGAVRSFRRHTTTEMLRAEAAVLSTAIGLQGAGRAVVDQTTVERVLAARPSLSAEQAAMVRRLATSGDGVEVVVGKAGSGKTHALAAAREAWQAAGHPVLGAAVAARAALALQGEAGIRSMTVTRLLAQTTHHDGSAVPGGIPPGCVIVVDEAGMLGTRPLGRLLALAQSAQAKIVLVGDLHQLPELEAGGVFRALADRLGGVQLRQNRRQACAWERAALDELRTGDPLIALETYRAGGRVCASASGAQAREDLVGAWWATGTGFDDARRTVPDRVMLAPRRADVAELNARARDLMRRAGRLTGPDLTIPVGEDGQPRAFAAGDVVVARRNAFGHGLVNGARGRVTAVHPGEKAVAVRFGDRIVTVSRSYMRAGYLDHGYALTIHQAQGLTVDRAFVLGSEAIYREAAYVGMSRGRHRNDLHTGAGVDQADPLSTDCDAPLDTGQPEKQLERALVRSRAQHAAHDLGR